jgi:DNA end-binding protein Ku
MPRSIWSGAISFGLVMLPVKLYPATEPGDVRFHEFDPGSGRRIRHRRVVEDEGKTSEREPGGGFAAGRAWEAEPWRPAAGVDDDPEAALPDRPSRFPPDPSPGERDVRFSDVALGYEVEPGKTVLLSREEIRALRPERSRSIEIEEFVDLADIDPISFEKSYYAVPQPGAGGERAYGLLVAALDHAGKVGIGRVVLRTREHLAAIRSSRGILVLETLFHADEVRDPSEVYRPPAEGVASATERELELAEQLIGVLAAEWDPAGHEDRDRERLLDLIRRKAGAATISTPERIEAPANVSDLMESLRASVEALREREASRDRQTG